MSTRDPPIFCIRVLHFWMDCVAVAQLIFSGTSTETSFWSIFSTHVTDNFGLCNDVANRDHMFCYVLLAAPQLHFVN